MLKEELKVSYNARIWKEKYGNLIYLALFFFLIFILFLSLGIRTLLLEFPLSHLYSVIIAIGIVIISIYIFFLIDLRNSIPFLDRIGKRKTNQEVINKILKDIYSKEPVIIAYFIVIIVFLILTSIFKLLFEKNSLTYLCVAVIWFILMYIPYSIRCRTSPVRAIILRIHLIQLINLFTTTKNSERRQDNVKHQNNNKSKITIFDSIKIQGISRLLKYIGDDLSIIANDYLGLNIKDIQQIPVEIYVAMILLKDKNVRDEINDELTQSIEILKDACYSDNNQEYLQLIEKTKNGFIHILTAFQIASENLRQSYSNIIYFNVYQSLAKRCYGRINYKELATVIGIVSAIISILRF